MDAQPLSGAAERMAEGPARAAPLASAVFHGALMLVGLRFAMRAIGFVSVVVTARLLTPADFGVMGTVAIVTGLFAILGQIGITEGLARLRTLEPGHVESAWTLNLIMAIVISAGLFLSAAPASRLLEEPQVEAALRWLAFSPLLAALASPGTMLLLREMRFRDEFILRAGQKIVLVCCTIAGAYAMRSWWGLVYGSLIGTLLGCALTYLLHPTRPALRLDRAREFLGFSFWTLVMALATYLSSIADEVAVRREADTATYGLYHASRDLSRVLVSEAVAPAAGALLPGMARLQDEPERFAAAAERAVGVGAIIAIAFGLGVSLTAAEVVGLLLGPQWLAAVPFLALVALGNIGQTLAGLHRGILAAMGRVRWSAGLWVLRAAVLVPACVLAAKWGGPIAVGATFAIVSCLLAVFDYALIFRALRRPWALRDIFARPLAAAGAMALAVMLLPLPEGAPLLLAALAKAAAGAAAYGLVLLGLWWAVGRPSGAEATLIQRLPRPMARRLLPVTTSPTPA
jgi:lipopolysaccharide exporter